MWMGLSIALCRWRQDLRDLGSRRSGQKLVRRYFDRSWSLPDFEPVSSDIHLRRARRPPAKNAGRLFVGSRQRGPQLKDLVGHHAANVKKTQ
jgi:hypothetical protein